MHKHTRVVRVLALGAVFLGLLTCPVSAATSEVEATDEKTFDPGDVRSVVGSSVHWAGTPSGSNEEHSVRQDAGIFDSGEPATGLDFTRTFSAGTFLYHCEKHGDDGMVGVVRVAPKVGAAPAGLPFTVTWATGVTNTGTLFDVEYRVGKGAWTAWLTDTTTRRKVFGADDSPVRAVNGGYSFRVRSGTSTAQSSLSPVKSFQVS